MTIRDMLIIGTTIAVGAVSGSIVILTFLPLQFGVPIVSMVGTMAASSLAPLIANIIVTKTVRVLKIGQEEARAGQDEVSRSQKALHAKIDRIEHDVNSTATNMTEKLEAIRIRNVQLEVKASRDDASLKE